MLLSKILRDSQTWADFKELEAQMHTNLTFRVTVNVRAKDGSQNGDSRKDSKKEPPKDVSKIVYCSDYYKKSCPFDDHHQGMFNKKTVTKWHICNKCLHLEGNPKRSHPGCDYKQA